MEYLKKYKDIDKQKDKYTIYGQNKNDKPIELGVVYTPEMADDLKKDFLNLFDNVWID